MSSSLLDSLGSRILASFGGIRVSTNESFDLIAYLRQHADQLHAVVADFNPVEGLVPPVAHPAVETARLAEAFGSLTSVVQDPDRAAQAVQQFFEEMGRYANSILETSAFEHSGQQYPATPELLATSRVVQSYQAAAQKGREDVQPRLLVVLQNQISAAALQDNAVIHRLQAVCRLGQSIGVTFLVQTHEHGLGTSLIDYYVPVRYEEPDEAERTTIVRSVYPEFSPEENESHQAALVESAGLTRQQLSDISALAVKEGCTGEQMPGYYRQLKIEQANEDELLLVKEPSRTFDDLFGLDGLRDFSVPILSRRSADPDMQPKGMLFVGPMGTGKSDAAQALAVASGRAYCELPLGSLRSRWQGESEQRLSRALKIAESLAPAVLLIDELEKAISGVESSGQTEGGTGSRMMGKLLTWMQQRERDVVVLATVNHIGRLLESAPEIIRAERFDAIFAFDLPNLRARQAIWDHYLRKYGYTADSAAKLAKLSDNWTPAEIKTACRVAAIRDVTVEEQLPLVPLVINTAGDQERQIQKEAHDKFLSAAELAIYKRREARNKEKHSRSARRRSVTASPRK